MKRETMAALIIWGALGCFGNAIPAVLTGSNLVKNSTFEYDTDNNGVPDGWTTSGGSEVRQELTRDVGQAGGHSARLACTAFGGDTPGAHAMVCQVGHAEVNRGQWYRLGFWVKGEDVDRSICHAKLANTRTWASTGIGASFAVTPTWRYIEKFCQSTADVPAEHSRLQFWFTSTGTLWLDHVTFEAVDMRQRYLPELLAGDTRNLIPNASFECGTGGWGSYSPQLPSWPGNLFRHYGEVDPSESVHGRQSLRVRLDKEQCPVLYWDSFNAHIKPVHSLMTAHHGWVRVQPGRPYTFSCFLKANRPGVPTKLLAVPCSGDPQQLDVRVGTQWMRHQFTFTPQAEYVWMAAGQDLRWRSAETSTLWVDAVQLEPGRLASEFRCRAEIEVYMETTETGNLFFDPEKGLKVDLRLFNAAEKERSVRGHVVATDFFDREVLRHRIERTLPPRGRAHVSLPGLLAGREGFYRFRWQPEEGASTPIPDLRCALLRAYTHTESVFGMNHAYPWEFLLRLCKPAGLTWIRDWSVKWHTVEPKRGMWDFAKTDPQIDRVVDAGLTPLVLLPFPSAPWSSAANRQMIREQARGDAVVEERYLMACPAQDPADFRNYVKQSVQQYRNRVRHYAVLNEPLYTMYAVPDRFGYGMQDYLKHLKDAHRAIKSEQPDATVIGGIGAWADSHWVKEFIEADGLSWCDVMDMHLYPATIPPEMYADDLQQCVESMRTHGGAKPIWLTEFGCYADDDPHMMPEAIIGDSAMSRANWPSERAASEALVKTAAVFLSHGVEKIFYHAGMCRLINGNTGESVFFEYGGAPRKMYAAQNVLARLLGPAPEPISVNMHAPRLKVYAFKTGSSIAAIVWSSDDNTYTLPLSHKVSAKDIMGNAIVARSAAISGTPVYLTAEDIADLALLECL
jgi:hypothetical protein